MLTCLAGVDFEALVQTPGENIRLPGLQKRTQHFGGAVELINGIRGLFEDLAGDIRRKAEGFSAFVTPGVVGKTAEAAMCLEEQHEGPESLGQRLSSLHTGQMARASKHVMQASRLPE